MASWQNVREKVQEAWQKDDPKSVSTLTHINAIIDKAEKWEIDPSDAQAASPSNLREIIRKARAAVEAVDKESLEELFRMAATCSNRDLRLMVRDLHLQVIQVMEIPGELEPYYRMEITRTQLDKFEKALKLQFKFKVKK